MVKAWYMDNNLSNDQRLEHHKNPPEFVNIQDLFKKTGVEYFHINVDTYSTDGVLDKIKKDRGYTYEDEIKCSDKCDDYKEKLKIFYTEHLHTDEEIRLVLEGSGYFDIRDPNDQWIRIFVSPGDMIILPSGSYHRFTLDVNNYIHAKRFFVGEPVWLAHNRPADEMACRQEYISKQHRGFVPAAC